MISQDDIDAMAENEPAIEAADTFLKRAARGLPFDRWCDGSNGGRMVAAGIMEYQRRLAVMTETAANLFVELSAYRRNAEDACEVSADPMRKDEGGA